MLRGSSASRPSGRSSPIDERAERLATLKAIGQLNSVERRLVALFWHLAERWGRMSGDGVVVPLTLSHRLLGELVGARRPTVHGAGRPGARGQAHTPRQRLAASGGRSAASG